MKPRHKVTSAVSAVLLAGGLTVGGTVVAAPAQAGDVYSSYSELAANETEGVDYQKRSTSRSSNAIHIAIHGGKIEYRTTELAEHGALVGSDSFYTFEGIKSSNNFDLHITSTKFDEPRALNMVGDSSCTISWHGYAGGDAQRTYVGGRDTDLRNSIRSELRSAGFDAPSSVPDRYAGTSKNNITNRNANSAGVQLELSREMREALMPRGIPVEAMDRYIAAVDRAVSAHC